MDAEGLRLPKLLEHIRKVPRPSYVDGDCWEWLHAKSNERAVVSYQGKQQNVARVVWKLFYGPPKPASDPIPKGMQVQHKCDNRSCVNPAHLKLGTPQDNMADKTHRGRCPVGELCSSSKLTEVQVLEIRRLHTVERWSCIRLGWTFGVSTAMVSCIVNRKNWKHI